MKTIGINKMVQLALILFFVPNANYGQEFYQKINQKNKINSRKKCFLECILKENMGIPDYSKSDELVWRNQNDEFSYKIELHHNRIKIFYGSFTKKLEIDPVIFRVLKEVDLDSDEFKQFQCTK
ncbi:MAG: hypothetical protein RLP13_13795 [Cytophagales bacterium]